MSTPTRSFCSVHAKVAGFDPSGTAWAAGRFLIPALRLPWPMNPLEARVILPGVPEALETLWQEAPESGIFAVAPILAFDFARTRGGQAARIDYLVLDELVAPCLLALARSRALPGEIAIVATPYRDVMIITHGSRDTCCATFGFPFYRGLQERFEHEPVLRIWRASHFGVHAFAPTMMIFPDGRS